MAKWFFFDLLLNGFGSRVLSSLVRFLFLYIIPDFLLWKRVYLKRNKVTSHIDFILEDLTKDGRAIAHRGGIPENTVRAFHKSKLGGARAVEVDLQFTKDDHPVLFHDWTVDRVSDRSGHLHDMTLQDIQSLDVGYKYGHEGVTVPTLYEGIDAIKELDMYMFLELKEGEEKAVSTVITLFQNDPSLYDRIIVISFFPHLLYQIRLRDPNIVVGLVMRKTVLTIDPTGVFRFSSRWKYWLVYCIERVMSRLLDTLVWKLLGVSLVLPHKMDILENRFDVNYYRRHGVRIVTWTVNSDDEKEYFSKVLQLPYMTDHITPPD